MRYISTRDKRIVVSGATAIARGISKESGLFVPEAFPQLSREELKSLTSLTYQERTEKIFAPFLPEFSSEEIKESVHAAYNTNFSHEQIAPVVKLTESAHILELWHGPTCAFKDMALQVLPQLLTRSMKKVGEGKEAVILVATSGDTGKAALDGFSNVEGTRMMVFYPEGGVSQIQKLQMSTQAGENLEVFAVIGNFDDTQTAVKEIFTNLELGEKLAEKNMMFSSANSINWGRLMPQIVYYFSAYSDLVKAGEIALGDIINVCVPTGNFGNILAAYYAKQMGLPIAKFICASNENNVLTDFLKTGIYDANRDFMLTASPSMDILISSNLERLLFHMSGNNDTAVVDYMKSLKETGTYMISKTVKEKISKEFYGNFCTDEETLQVIKACFDNYNYLCDTHTAVALGVYQKYQEETGDNTKTIIASTANPYKFADNILKAIDSSAEPVNEFETLTILSEKTGTIIPPQIAELKEKEVRFTKVLSCDEMETTVKGSLGL